MKTRLQPSPYASHRSRSTSRGSVLITALLIAIAIAIGLAGYLQLSRNSLAMAHRTYFANDAVNLAEAGLEEALYSFQRMNAGAAPADAWADWTISGANAMRTLTPFNRDQQAVGIVKVFVCGYNGSVAAPYAISQATITPFDGTAPVVKLLRIALKKAGLFNNGVVGLAGLNLNGKPVLDSFDSNPSGSSTGPWAAYPGTGAHANNSIVVTAGTVDLGNGLIKGNLSIADGITPPPDSQVTGGIQTGYTGSFTMPTYPTAASVDRSYNLTSIPSTLPATGQSPASDGHYYYFVSGKTVGNTTIKTGTNVVIVGSGGTKMSSGLKIQTNATCAIYMDGPLSISGNGAINSTNWAGALQIYTTTNSACSLAGNGKVNACLFAPNAALTASGNGAPIGSFIAKTVTVSGNGTFHYDEALLRLETSGGASWGLSSWFDLYSDIDRETVTTLTDNFLP